MNDPRAALRQLADTLADALETTSGAAKYYNQNTAPIAKSAYLKLVRSGVVEGFKVGAHILVRRADLDSFIEKRRVEPFLIPEPPPLDEDAAADAAVKRMVGQKV